MQFHHFGYVSADPRVQPAAGTGIDRPVEIPDEVDVLIVGAGPAGMILAAQLSQFPTLTTRLVEKRPGRLEVGQADGIQARSVETFQAFGFAERIAAEAYRITHTNFWAPDPDDPAHIVRTSRTEDDPTGISEFPHLIVNQARVLDYFAEFARNGPTRTVPDYGWELVGLEIAEEGERPVTVTLRRSAGDDVGRERTVRAAYVVGCDGARSKVRESIGRTLHGQSAMHAWAVMDVLAVTDFPDIRTKCAIQSRAGSILLIPREGGFLFRMYVDLGEMKPETKAAVRSTTIDEAVEHANAILSPYTLEVKDVAWYSVYEVGHRLTDAFDDVGSDAVDGAGRSPRVFIAGDACHTHSAKAGQGMNVSMQDGFNLAWKLGYVLTGRSPATLLSTYSAERQVVAQNLIDFDKEWSSLMADPDVDPNELAGFYVRTLEFLFGFMTHYAPSMIVGEATHQQLASGWTIGRRFKSAPVIRVADGNPIHLGHHHRADGRWRIYVFADAGPNQGATAELASWLATSPESPVVRFTPPGADLDAVFDVKVIYPLPFDEVELGEVPSIFMPRVGPFGLIDYEKVYAIDPAADIREARGIAAEGAVVVVRPDQYVAHVLPLTAHEELAEFFAQSLLPAR